MSSHKTTDVRLMKVAEDDDGQRLDRWLKKYVPELPYDLSQKLIRKGQIRVDGKRGKTDTRLTSGQEIRIPPIEPPAKSGEKKKLSQEDVAYIRSLVIYDDGDVIAINKPYGLPVQGGSKVKRHLDGMLDGLKDKKGVRPRLVHRLDKDTSGVLLLARSAKVAKELGHAFQGREIRKIYWALVTPTPAEPMAAINAPIAKGGGFQKEKMQVNEEEGKKAITEYEVLEHASDKVAFVAFWPRTGRTHQIRIHAQVMGSPILGDFKYGFRSDMVEGIQYPERLHLHAHRLILRHPTQNIWLDVSAPLPPDLKKSWQAFGFNPKNKDNVFADLES